MPVILHRSTIKEGPGYDAVLIDSGERLWLGLIESAPDGVFNFWSTKLGESEPTSYRTLISELTRRLRLVHQSKDNVDDALIFWPSGWDYWGGCNPGPISSYTSSREFRRMFSRWNDQVC